MATAVLRTNNMTLGQNMHMLPMIVSSSSTTSSHQTPVIMHHHHHIMQGKRPIAPATSEQRSNVMAALDQNRMAKSKSKLSFTHMQHPYGAQPASVQRRNARERNRVKQVNNGFANLRQHIPSDVITALTNGGRGASKKLSKVDTLKLAVEYIRRLQDLLDENENDTSSTSTHSHNSSSYFAASPMQHSIPPTCSEASASPTPSYTSEVSSGNAYVQAQPPYKYEVYESYSNPEDEELLDCIQWWQQQ